VIRLILQTLTNPGGIVRLRNATNDVYHEQHYTLQLPARDRIRRMAAAIAVFGIICCGILAMAVSMYLSSVADAPLKLYAILFFLALIALYFLVRFIHWAWDTPLPFGGTTP
jgi:uncharacterized BrkB/YihY/UPF0761 family membrane protein